MLAHGGNHFCAREGAVCHDKNNVNGSGCLVARNVNAADGRTVILHMVLVAVPAACGGVFAGCNEDAGCKALVALPVGAAAGSRGVLYALDVGNRVNQRFKLAGSQTVAGFACGHARRGNVGGQVARRDLGIYPGFKEKLSRRNAGSLRDGRDGRPCS